eukprot:jgi/Bigna1/128367/aug1.6_g3075
MTAHQKKRCQEKKEKTSEHNKKHFEDVRKPKMKEEEKKKKEIPKDEKVPTKPKVDDETVEAFVKNIDNHKGQNGDTLIELGLAKPDVEEKEQCGGPSWHDGFEDIDNHNDDINGHETKTVNVQLVHDVIL